MQWVKKRHKEFIVVWWLKENHFWVYSTFLKFQFLDNWSIIQCLIRYNYPMSLSSQPLFTIYSLDFCHQSSLMLSHKTVKLSYQDFPRKTPLSLYLWLVYTTKISRLQKLWLGLTKKNTQKYGFESLSTWELWRCYGRISLSTENLISFH